MQIDRGKVVKLDYELKDSEGETLEDEGAQLEYLHGGYGGLLEGLEHALEGRKPGEEVRVQLEPEQAFGEYDAEHVRVEPAERYGDGLAVGMQVEEEGNIYTVSGVAEGKAVLDGNHPLAGMALRFFLKIISVRAARPEEIQQGVSLMQ